MERLANYSQAEFVAAGFPHPFYANLSEIYVDEQTHVSLLSNALTAAGVTPTVELVYRFPATDPLSLVTLSSVLEGVAVSAYLGCRLDRCQGIRDSGAIDPHGRVSLLVVHSSRVGGIAIAVPFRHSARFREQTDVNTERGTMLTPAGGTRSTRSCSVEEG
ncbi:hypothetical protein MMC17_005326 [Xylographa soralifera]|nr:hypothetical protein [Xylographa soralifera]